jgi:hypothetical protein
MLTTRRELLDDFLATMSAGQDPRARDRAERLLNRAMTALWQRHPWTIFQAPTPHVLTTVVGQRTYALPVDFGRLAGHERTLVSTTTGRRVWPVDPQVLAVECPTQGTPKEAKGVPTRYYLAGTAGVGTQPDPDGEACEVLSSSAADTTVHVVVTGLDGDGVEQRKDVTLTGATAVDVGTWSEIRTFSKSYPAGVTPTTELTSSAGTVTLRTTTDQTTLQALTPGEPQVARALLALVPWPDAADTIAVPYLRRPLRLRYDSDPIPEDWDLALLEEMTLQWRVAAGELAMADAPRRPAFLALVSADNAARPRTPRVPYGGL